VIEFNIERSIIEKRRGPDLMPLIDMVFILLIFFLLTSSALQPAVDVELPETTRGNSTNPPSLVITIQSGGTVLINGDPVSMDLLRTILESRYQEKPNTELMIQADRRAAFGQVVTIMDLCKKAGIEDVSFLVEVQEMP
jgi:biopolymer transport protein ExbD